MRPEELNFGYFGYFGLLVLYLESYGCLCSLLGVLIIFGCLINDQLPPRVFAFFRKAGEIFHFVSWNLLLKAILLCSPDVEALNLEISGNNRFFAFFDALDLVDEESGGCQESQVLAFKKNSRWRPKWRPNKVIALSSKVYQVKV